MKHDETPFDSNPLPPIEPELEARVVAWVLGEASPFEAAELERRCAAEPALAAFRREMLVTHGWVREATRPQGAAGAVWRLAPERRAALRAVLGDGTSDGAGGGGGAGSVFTVPVAARTSGGWPAWVMPLAVCVALGGFLAAIIIPTTGKVRETARRSVMDAEGREDAALYSREPLAVESRVVGMPSALLPAEAESQLYGAMPAQDGASFMSVPSAPPPAGLMEATEVLDNSQWSRGPSITGGTTEVLKKADRFAGVTITAGRPEDFGLGFESVSESDMQGRFAVGGAAPLSKDVGGREFADARRSEAVSAEVRRRRAERNAGKADRDGPMVEGAKSTLEAKAERQLAAPPPMDDTLRAELATADEAVSTFSLHVGDASFRLAKAALERGETPDPAAIRPEEFYNAFDYGDPAPAAGEPVACRFEQAAHPFLQQRNLVRIALRVPAAGRGAGTPLHLTVLLDTSGSMEREDRAATVGAALGSLASLLGPNDRVTLVGFARQPRLLVESLPGDQAGRLVDLAARTPAEGGTNLEEALKLAGELARRQWRAGAQNRIVLLTDGAANLGDADPARLAAQVETLRRQGVAFDACGVGADGLDDGVLEALTRKGDGRYQVLNSPEEADAGFARKLAGAFRPAAENVKVQVRFNPERVARYRLIGFEKHRLREEDFRNDRVDAAELAAEEAAVALYQVEVIPGAELGDLGDVAVRFRDPARGEMVERNWTLAYEPQPPSFDRASASLQLAGASALLAEKLRGGTLAGTIRLEELAPVVTGLRGAFAGDARVEALLRMFEQTRRLSGE